MSVQTITVSTPIGPLRLEAEDGALVGVYMEEEGLLPPRPRPFGRGANGQDGGATDPILERAAGQLAAWFRGERRVFDLPLRPRGSPFQQAVWEELTRIPYGETRTYGHIAARLGRPSAVRAVGAANGRNPLAIVVPCHRVVGADGTLTGYAGGLERKRWLLDHERRVLNAPFVLSP